jgi:hypothetical protein
MSNTDSKDTVEYAVATDSQRTLKDLKVRPLGQPVCAIGGSNDAQGTEGAFQHFNIRLAVVKFSGGKTLGYDPLDLLLPCEIHDDGEAYFEIRRCQTCEQIFPLTSDEFRASAERSECPECQP